MKKDGQYSMDDYFLRQVDVRLCLREASPLYSSEAITSPESAVNVMASEMRSLDNEHLCVVNLNTALQPINFTVASIGGLNYTCAEARHVFKSAILSNAASIILIHNHPSGDVTPSKEDHSTTIKMIEAGRLLGIYLMDHVIVGAQTGECFSFHQQYPEYFKGDLDYQVIQKIINS